MEFIFSEDASSPFAVGAILQNKSSRPYHIILQNSHLLENGLIFYYEMVQPPWGIIFYLM